MPLLKPSRALLAPLSAGGGGDPVVTKSLTAAQARAAHGAPILWVPAQGVGRVIIPIAYMIEVNVGATPFAGGTQSRWVTGTGMDVSVDNESMDFTTNRPWTQWFPCYPYATKEEAGNQPLWWTTQDALTAGSGNLVISLHYQVWTF